MLIRAVKAVSFLGLRSRLVKLANFYLSHRHECVLERECEIVQHAHSGRIYVLGPDAGGAQEVVHDGRHAPK